MQKKKTVMRGVTKQFLTAFLKFAVLGSVLLTFFYFLILYLVTKDLNHPLSQLKALNPWISILIIGFGVQTGLFGLIYKGYCVKTDRNIKTNIGASAGFSGVSMIACCAHHIADVVPVLGASGIALFLTEYQKETLMLGVVTNTIGILYMIWIITGKESPKTIFNLVFH